MKRFYVFICFIFIFLLTPFIANAKSYESENISVEFGNGNTLNLGTQGYNKFDVEEDMTFYYDGILYTLTDNDLASGGILIGEDNLLYSNKTLTSNKNHEFYLIPIDVIITGNKTYTFTQQVCYKMATLEGCYIDNDDISEVVAGRYTHRFFYDFLPFYKEGLEFDYLYFNLTFVNTEDETDVTKIDNLGFFVADGDVILYKDNFGLEMYDYGNNSYYNGKEYIFPACLSYGYNIFYGQYLVDGVYTCRNELYLTVLISAFSSNLDNSRNYRVRLEMYVDNGEGYEPFAFDNSDIILIKTGIMGNQTYNYVELFSGSVAIDEGALLYIPISNIITYNYDKNEISHINYKFSLSYICESGCSDSRAVTTMETKEGVYELDVDNPTLTAKAINGVELVDFYTIKSNEDAVVQFTLFDHNGIGDISYFISDKQVESDYENKSYTAFTNGDTITISGEDGFYYVHFKVFEICSQTYYYVSYRVILDTKAPVITANNFSSYSSSSSYSDITIYINYSDESYDYNNTPYRSIAYYKVISESERADLSVEDVIDANQYVNGVVMNKDTIGADGVYLVCFVLKDYANNYSELLCSNTYYIDISALTKEEVSLTSQSGYSSVVKTVITIEGLDEGASFRCGLSKVDITSENELTNNCYNKKETNLSVQDEAIYNLWIYASDYAGNYSLIKLDEPFYVDSIAPRISLSVDGNKDVYSNNVKINVIYTDLSSVDEENLSYEFYLATYNQNKFTKFSLEDGISYPYDYYGTYKLAIKICDSVGNCDIKTSQDTYMIDTSKIKIELIGNEKITILQYQKYVEQGAKASKGNSGKTSIVVEYKISGSVDSSSPGTYKLIYSAGEGINKVSVEREVVVTDSNIYIVSIALTLALGELIILARLFIKRKKNDNI